MDRELVSISKFLSLVLRHKPGRIGLQLADDGWVEIDQLLRASAEHGRQIDRELLLRVVRENDKQRFAVSEDGQQIRANQGHSVEVNLGLTASPPPETLYHGTVSRFLESIRQKGLVPGSRQHVHLSADKQTAERVGQRRGNPVILVVHAAQMNDRGFEFYLSQNGVWLAEHVPVEFIAFPGTD